MHSTMPKLTRRAAVEFAVSIGLIVLVWIGWDLLPVPVLALAAIGAIALMTVFVRRTWKEFLSSK
jgi:hypothetical protein